VKVISYEEKNGVALLTVERGWLRRRQETWSKNDRGYDVEWRRLPDGEIADLGLWFKLRAARQFEETRALLEAAK
jgi:hypothetical protein